MKLQAAMKPKPPTLADYGELLLIEFLHSGTLRENGLLFDGDGPDYSVDIFHWVLDALVQPHDRPFFKRDAVWDRWIKIRDQGSEADVRDFPRWLVEESPQKFHTAN